MMDKQKTMTNRERLVWAISFSEYEDREVAEIICQMIDAVGGFDYNLKTPLKKWLGFYCDPETNNWGELEKQDRADYEEDWEEEEGEDE